MRSLDFRVEHDRQAALAQPESELDVLDRRIRIARGVEAAGSDEDILAHRAAARPERGGVPGLAIVVIAVDEILVLRQEILSRGALVVAAEDRGRMRPRE